MSAQNLNHEIRIRSVKHRVYFAHLRNVKKDSQGNLYESDHLEGDVDMVSVVKILIQTMQEKAYNIPMRPDHGHQILDDIHKNGNPGYSAIGRLKRLAELRGLEPGLFNRTLP